MCNIRTGSNTGISLDRRILPGRSLSLVVFRGFGNPAPIPFRAGRFLAIIRDARLIGRA